MKTLLALLLITGGLVCLILSGYLFWQRYNPNRLAFDIKKASELTKTTSRAGLTPVRITIKAQAIDLPLVPASLLGTTWATTDLGASYLISTPLPGDPGNSVIYGHNFKNLFGNLVLVKPHDKVSIYLSDGSKRDFKVNLTQEVDPSATEVLTSSKTAKLTLYTCSGFLDSKRFVAVATPL